MVILIKIVTEPLRTQVPEEEVPLRSVTVASDGSMLIAANNKVRLRVNEKLSIACLQKSAQQYRSL
jgi:hypothetical protein